MNKEVNIKPYVCSCGAIFNAGMHLGPENYAKPLPGHIMICMDCQALYKWNADDTMSPCTEEDIRYLKEKHPMKWFKIQLEISKLKSKRREAN